MTEIFLGYSEPDIFVCGPRGYLERQAKWNLIKDVKYLSHREFIKGLQSVGLCPVRMTSYHCGNPTSINGFCGQHKAEKYSRDTEERTRIIDEGRILQQAIKERNNIRQKNIHEILKNALE